MGEVSLANTPIQFGVQLVPIQLVLFLFIAAVFFRHAEAFYSDEVPFVYSFLYGPCFRGCVCEDVAA